MNGPLPAELKFRENTVLSCEVIAAIFVTGTFDFWVPLPFFHAPMKCTILIFSLEIIIIRAESFLPSWIDVEVLLEG